jgi:acyl carrier protein
MSVEGKVKGVLAQEIDVEVEELRQDAFLADAFGIDPYDLDQLASALSEEFEIEFDEDEVELWSTVGDVIQSVLEKVEE